MGLIHAVLVAGLAAAFPANVALVGNGAGGSKNHLHVVHGVVTSVDATTGLVTVKVHHHAKKGTGAPAHDTQRKFHVNKQTAIEVVSGGKGQRVHKPATLADIQAGEHVAVVPRPDHPHLAAKLEIVMRNKAN